MRSDQLVSAERSVLVVVDVQERLAASMKEEVFALVRDNILRLIEAARTLDVPVIYAEQYPRGLGPTDERIREALVGAAAPRFEKLTFSCADAEAFSDALGDTDRTQVVLTGMESHVCVLQTAFDLSAGGLMPFVVADAVCSRFRLDYDVALDRMRSGGVRVATTESVIFEWLGRAGTDDFKALRGIFRK